MTLRETVIRFLLAAVLSASMADRGHADSAGDPAERVQAGTILEAGEIDGSTVEVGAFAVVIHGRGEPNPVTGDWEQLLTTRGYIQACGSETLTLSRGRDGPREQIALDRILTLVLVGSRSSREVEGIGIPTTERIFREEQSSTEGPENRDSATEDREVEAADDAPAPGSALHSSKADSGLAHRGYSQVPVGLSPKIEVGTLFGFSHLSHDIGWSANVLGVQFRGLPQGGRSG